MDENALLTGVMRSLGAAWRALRLYPPSSPMPMEAAAGVCTSVEGYLQAEPSLKLDVVRQGFILRGIEGVLTAPGVPDLADALGSHGIGEVHFVAPPSADEVIALLTAAQLRPQELHANGGMQITLNRANVGSIKVIAVALSKIETPPEIPEEEADKFLAELAGDPNRLAVWLRSLLASDDEGLTDGILTLANAAVDVRVFGRTMAAAFLELDMDDKDRLLEVSIDLEPLERVMTEMIANLSSVELTAAIRGGRYGANSMSLSYVLTALPFGDRGEELLIETEAALRSADANEAQIAFLEHMVAMRRAGDDRPPLIDAQPIYRAMLAGLQLTGEHLASLVSAVTSRQRLDREGVATMMRLLELADDFTSYSRVIDALARSVPHLLETGDPALAMDIMRTISEQTEATSKPWPELQNHLEAALDEICSTRTMAALLALASTDPNAIEYAKELVTFSGDKAARSLAAAAIQSEAEDSMAFAQSVLGRRLPELLAPEAPHVDALRAGKLAELLAADGGPWCMQALTQLTNRLEDNVRTETARGVCKVGGGALRQVMPRMLRDSSAPVAKLSARLLARNGTDEAIGILAQRLGELEGEKDLPMAREIIGLLAESPSPRAASALSQLAEGRGGLRRKGWRSEMRRLAAEAVAARQGRGA